jgi:hypothetical protein
MCAACPVPPPEARGSGRSSGSMWWPARLLLSTGGDTFDDNVRVWTSRRVCRKPWGITRTTSMTVRASTQRGRRRIAGICCQLFQRPGAWCLLMSTVCCLISPVCSLLLPSYQLSAVCCLLSATPSYQLSSLCLLFVACCVFVCCSLFAAA